MDLQRITEEIGSAIEKLILLKVDAVSKREGCKNKDIIPSAIAALGIDACALSDAHLYGKPNPERLYRILEDLLPSHIGLNGEKTENEKTVFADLIAADLEWDFQRDRQRDHEHPNTLGGDWMLETVSVTIDVSDCEFIPLEVCSRDATGEQKAPWTAKLIAGGESKEEGGIIAEYVTQQDFSA